MASHSRTYFLALILTVFSVMSVNAFPFSKSNVESYSFVDEIRVSIMNHLDLDAVSVSSRTGSMTVMTDSESFSIRNSESVSLVRRNDRVELKIGGKKISSPFVTIVSPPGGSFDVQVNNRSNIRTYTGSLEVGVQDRSTDLDIVNRVPLEDYVASVVGAEYGLDDLEGAKAMAVVVRTYALHALQSGKNVSDGESFQVYRGLSHSNEASRQAARSTAGQILTHDSSLIEAVYSASNGGHTAANHSVWGTTRKPYLRARKDPFDAKVSPHKKWKWSVDTRKLKKVFSDIYGFEVTDILISDTSDDGRVTDVRLRGNGGSRNITGSSFRATIARSFNETSLKSTYFKMRKSGGSYDFDGHGFGHGVGLSQWGAHGMALDGRSYFEILEFYYAGSQIEQSPASGLEAPGVEINVLTQSGNSEQTGSWTSNPRRASHSDRGDKAPTERDSKASENSEATKPETSDSRESEKRTGRKRKSRIGW